LNTLLNPFAEDNIETTLEALIDRHGLTHVVVFCNLSYARRTDSSARVIISTEMQIRGQ
jgi:hypothetical protein